MTTSQTALLSLDRDRETSRYAILAFLVALLSLSIPIPFLPPLVALSYARSAQAHITGDPARLKGKELTQAARSIARFVLWVETIVLVVAVLCVLAAIITARWSA